ncbi:MAG: hypothetical protein F6K09_30660, partial [Merismopedia sp. SIO2A8]|nr:hypothetical protein [Merismopedia sp. SIO2A8]
MDSAALWQRYQDWLYYHEGLQFYLDVSRMRFDQASDMIQFAPNAQLTAIIDDW